MQATVSSRIPPAGAEHVRACYPGRGSWASIVCSDGAGVRRPADRSPWLACLRVPHVLKRGARLARPLVDAVERFIWLQGEREEGPLQALAQQKRGQMPAGGQAGAAATSGGGGGGALPAAVVCPPSLGRTSPPARAAVERSRLLASSPGRPTAAGLWEAPAAAGLMPWGRAAVSACMLPSQ